MVLEMDATTNQAVCALFPSSKVDRGFLFWYLYIKREDLIEISFGGAQPNISQTIVKDITIPLPPLDEQKRIATIIDEQMQEVEIARQAILDELEAAEAMSAAYLREVFESEEAQCWERVQLGDILSRYSNIIHPKNNPVGEAIFVGLEHIESGTGKRIGNYEIEMSELTGRKPQFKQGQLVYGYLRPYLNKVWIAEFDGLCSVDQYTYDVNSELAITEFVHWFMLSPVYMERSPIGSHSSQLPRIRLDEVAATEINLPEKDTQLRIIKQISDVFEEIYLIKNDISERLETIEAMPAAILRRAFSGGY